MASDTIADNEFFNDGAGRRQQVTTFVDVAVWGKWGENFAALAKKGEEIIIEAELRRKDPKTARNIPSTTSTPKAASSLRRQKQGNAAIRSDVRRQKVNFATPAPECRGY